jgi:hypothetical protein
MFGAAKYYIAFRHMFEAVPKWEKHEFMRVCARLVSVLQYQPRWANHTYSRSLLYLFETYHDSDAWWQEIHRLSATELFIAFWRQLGSLRCVHHSQRTPVRWCSVCLGAAVKMTGAMCGT